MRKLIIAAVLLLVLTNMVVLSGVAYNRAGAPLVSIELTERELPVKQIRTGRDEDSGMALLLKWRVPYTSKLPEFLYTNPRSPAWLDEAKLAELGFDLRKLKSEKENGYKWPLGTSEVVLVLEYQGDAYQHAVAITKNMVNQLREKVESTPDDQTQVNKLKQYEGQLTRMKVSQTRLYMIDAGIDEQALAKKYSEKNKYLFARGEVRVRWNNDRIAGHIRRLYIDQLHVPLPYSQQLASLTMGENYYNRGTQSIPPRYQVLLNVGKRLEPWIGSVAQMH
jgi:hypothetical protein